MDLVPRPRLPRAQAMLAAAGLLVGARLAFLGWGRSRRFAWMREATTATHLGAGRAIHPELGPGRVRPDTALGPIGIAVAPSTDATYRGEWTAAHVAVGTAEAVRARFDDGLANDLAAALVAVACVQHPGGAGLEPPIPRASPPPRPRVHVGAPRSGHALGRNRALRISMTSMLVGLLAACSGKDDTSAGAATPSTRDCPTKRGAAMTRVALPSGRAFCIDNREATQEEYATFLADKPSWHPEDEPEICNSASREPDVTVEDDVPKVCPKGAYDPKGKAHRPMGCLDWCDAHAFCRWAGKRLCQRTDGGPLRYEEGDPSLTEATSFEKSEWAFACSSGGKYERPTGDKKVSCGTLDVDLSKLDDECSSPDAPFSSVHYLEGGAGEWVGTMTQVQPSGGWLSFLVPLEWPSCDVVHLTSGARANAGVRCCAD